MRPGGPANFSTLAAAGARFALAFNASAGGAGACAAGRSLAISPDASAAGASRALRALAGGLGADELEVFVNHTAAAARWLVRFYTKPGRDLTGCSSAAAPGALPELVALNGSRGLNVSVATLSLIHI